MPLLYFANNEKSMNRVVVLGSIKLVDNDKLNYYLLLYQVRLIDSMQELLTENNNEMEV
jgi:hypothetical protein